MRLATGRTPIRPVTRSMTYSQLEGLVMNLHSLSDMQQNIEPIIAKTTPSSYSLSAALTGGGFLTFLEQNATALGVLCLLLGAVLGVGTFFINWYYQHKRMMHLRYDQKTRHGGGDNGKIL